MTDARHGACNVEHYEQLRAHALEGEPAGFRLGLALLERRGLAAWSRSWSTTAAPRPAPAVPVPTTLAPVAADDQLVGALASMALARVAAG